MPKRFTAIFFVTAAISLHTHANASVIAPIGLAAGSEYQLIFITVDATPATSTSIGTYNSFVTTEAALSASLPSTTWDAIGSTATVNANVNAPNHFVNGSYLPVYNTQGIEVSGAVGLYSGDNLLSPILYDQYGLNGEGNRTAWTGSYQSQASPTNALGTANPIVGADFNTDPSWQTYTTFPSPADSEPLYALSGVLTVPSPEPSTITLIGLALTLLAGRRLLRRRGVA